MGISPDRSSKIIFQGKEFIRGSSFSIKNKNIGIDFCHTEEKKGYHCLLIEDSNSVTVWKSTIVKDQNSSSAKVERNELINRCRRELINCIGPMAELIIDELSDELDNMSPEQIVQFLAEQIPDPKLAVNFRHSMTK